VGRGVVAGEGVLRVQQADEEDVGEEHESRKPLECLDPRTGEQKAGRLVAVRRRRHVEHDDDDRHADEVPVHGDVVQEGDELDGEGVQQALDGEDDDQDADRVLGQQPVALVGVESEERRDREGAAEADAGGDGVKGTKTPIHHAATG
jgi:hypothetical protein